MTQVIPLPLGTAPAATRARSGGCRSPPSAPPRPRCITRNTRAPRHQGRPPRHWQPQENDKGLPPRGALQAIQPPLLPPSRTLLAALWEHTCKRSALPPSVRQNTCGHPSPQRVSSKQRALALQRSKFQHLGPFVAVTQQADASLGTIQRQNRTPQALHRISFSFLVENRSRTSKRLPLPTRARPTVRSPHTSRQMFMPNYLTLGGGGRDTHQQLTPQEPELRTVEAGRESGSLVPGDLRLGGASRADPETRSTAVPASMALNALRPPTVDGLQPCLGESGSPFPHSRAHAEPPG